MATTALSGRRLGMLDRYLDAAVEDLLRHHRRLAHVDVTGRADGGVVHLSGAVDDLADLMAVRDLVGRLAGVYAVWDRVRVAGREPRAVDLGCGDTRQYDGNLGLDCRAAGGVHAIADVARPLPLADASVDAVYAVHVLEHLLDWLPTVAECHRVLRPGGVLHVMSPHWGHVNAVADPTHVRYFDVQTFKYLCGERGDPCWYPLNAGTDGASVFADLVPVKDGPGWTQPRADPQHLARFFD
jgi:SAM-dependent methyltransferase